MAKKPDSGPREPNLELPSLSLGFRRRKRRQAADEQESAATAPVAAEPAPDPAPEAAPEPVPEPEAAPEPRPEPRPEPADARPPAPIAAAPEAAAPAPIPVAEPEPHAEPDVQPDVQPDMEPAERHDGAVRTRPIRPLLTGTPEAADTIDTAQTADTTAPVHRERRPSPLTRLPGAGAAVLAGIVCGLVGVVLTFLALRGCEAVRGVGSCGGIGLFALFVILVVEIFIGAALLKGAGVRDSFSTSFLGVGLVAVVIMLFLLSALDSLWMLLVVPLVTAATYLFSWWVTTRFVDVE